MAEGAVTAPFVPRARRCETAGKGLEQARQKLQALDKQIPEAGRRQIHRAFERIRSRMSKDASRPSGPIQWDSERQRKAYFASDGFGGGIPTRRSGLYETGWRIEEQGNGYRLSNAAEKYAHYVGGDETGAGQSSIHRGRWPRLRDVVAEETANLPEAVEKELETVG